LIQVASYADSLSPEPHGKVGVSEYVSGFDIDSSNYSLGCSIFVLSIWQGWLIGDTVGPKAVEKLLVVEFPMAIIILESLD
jgi:hypothetical protein